MTPARWLLQQAAWPTPRTTVTDYAGLVAAIGAGQRVTVSDGAVLVGAALDLPAGADVRSNSFLGSTLNFNITASASDVIVSGFRFGAGNGIVLTGCLRATVAWCFLGGGGSAAYGIRAINCNDTHFVGNYTRNYTTFGQSMEGYVSGLPVNSIRDARWDTIAHSPPVLDGNSECGLNFASVGWISGGEGVGSAWAEVLVAQQTDPAAPATPMLIENLRLEGARGLDIRMARRARLHAIRVTPALYGVITKPGQAGMLDGGSVLEDIIVQGGAWGLDLENANDTTVRRITAYNQSSVGIRQMQGSLLLDLASCDLQPAAGGVAFQFVP